LGLLVHELALVEALHVDDALLVDALYELPAVEHAVGLDQEAEVVHAQVELPLAVILEGLQLDQHLLHVHVCAAVELLLVHVHLGQEALHEPLLLLGDLHEDLLVDLDRLLLEEVEPLLELVVEQRPHEHAEADDHDEDLAGGLDDVDEARVQEQLLVVVEEELLEHDRVDQNVDENPGEQHDRGRALDQLVLLGEHVELGALVLLLIQQLLDLLELVEHLLLAFDVEHVLLLLGLLLLVDVQHAG